MDGYFYLHQFDCLKFRFFHMLPEIRKYTNCDLVLCSFQLRRHSGSVPQKFLATHWFCSSVVSCFLLNESHAYLSLLDDSDVGSVSVTQVSISVANNFVHLQSAADHGYYAFGAVSDFVYCLLQKMKRTRALTLEEQREEYTTPHHSKFAIEEERFFAGLRVLVALEKVGSYYLKNEFRRDSGKFLENFVNWILSTVSARSAIGQGLSCFSLRILLRGDEHSPLQLFGMMLD